MNLKYIKCLAFMWLRQPHISNIFVSGTPILWLRENGTTCPFRVFSLCRSNFCPILIPIPVMRPILVLLAFPLFCRHFSCFWVLPKLTVSFSTPIIALSTLPKHYILRKMPNFDAKTTTKLGKNKRTNGSIFTHAHPNILIFSSVCVLREPTQPKKISRFAMCIFGTWVVQQVDSDLRPANSPKHATDAGVQLMWERVLCNSSAINSPNIFLCNRLRGMSLHISEN